jgi:NADH-quinone oxidoreductase subunit J
MNALILAADNVNVAQNIAFGIIATVMIFAAFSVVTTKNVVHAALYLVVVLAGVAAHYIGAVMVLFLFGIMLTRAQIGKEEGLNNKGWQMGIPVALLLFGLMAYVIIDTFEDQVITEVTPFPTEGIADLVLSPFLVPFLAISFVLLAAAIGAIVLARKD